MKTNPYETLGLTSKATLDEIKTAYRTLAKKLHPDLNPGNKEAEKHFKEINSAYEMVGTPESRTKFDRGEFEELNDPRQGRGPFYRETQQEGGRYSQSFEGVDDDILQSIFGRIGGRGDVPGQDVLYKMDIEFKDSILGAEREITLPGGKNLRVKIPPGILSGTKLRFSGQGAKGRGKAPAGDAYVELHVKMSPFFKRVGNDLEIELPISIHEAALGGEVKVPTIESSVLLKIPASVTTGAKLRLTGKGVPNAVGKRGDQIIYLKIVMPSQMDSEFKKAVESWSQRQPYDPRAGWSGSIEGGA